MHLNGARVSSWCVHLCQKTTLKQCVMRLFGALLILNLEYINLFNLTIPVNPSPTILAHARIMAADFLVA